MTAKHDKKSVPWDKDPDILARLAMVATMMNQGALIHQIAAALGVSISTANRDVARVKELWRRASKDDIEDQRAASIASLIEIKTRAWEDYRAAKKSGGHGGMAALRLALDVEKEIAAMQGTKITKIDLTSQGESIADPRRYSDAELAAQLARLLPEAQSKG